MPFQPMQGVKILEVAQFTFTPAAAGVLADWGADVIKVEHPVAGDAQRGLIGPVGLKVGTFMPVIDHPNRGKRSIGLALDDPAGRDILYELAKSSDVFLTNFLPDARRRLEIDLEHIRAVNPDIIYVRGSAFGIRGPEAEKGGYDSSAFWSRAGSAAGVTPVEIQDQVLGMPSGAYGDSMGGMTIAGGVAGALFHRSRTGEPVVVDVSLLGVGAWAMALNVTLSLLSGEPPEPQTLGPSPTAVINPTAGNFRTKDGRFINLTFLQPGRYWADFCRHLDRPDLVDDPRFSTVEALLAHSEEAHAIVIDELGRRTLAELTERFITLEGQWAPIQNALEVGRDPQLIANGAIADVVDSDGNVRQMVASPVQFNEEPVTVRRAPLFAEHTDEILRELGRTEDQIIKLKIDGTIT
jgi:crotonobetainyl-CoA:carnitine CoA-transferase CaiB-like acyl-CoA transferase